MTMFFDLLCGVAAVVFFVINMISKNKHSYDQESITKAKKEIVPKVLVLVGVVFTVLSILSLTLVYIKTINAAGDVGATGAPLVLSRIYGYIIMVLFMSIMPLLCFLAIRVMVIRKIARDAENSIIVDQYAYPPDPAYHDDGGDLTSYYNSQDTSNEKQNLSDWDENN